MYTHALAFACALGVVLSAYADNDSLTMNMGKETLSVQEGTASALTYKYANVPRKPYVMAWFSPKGVNVLRDAPADHLHHHGLMLAITAEGVNFWEESASGGFQEHRAFVDQQVNEDSVSFTELLEWRGPEAAKPFLLERRTVTYHKTGDADSRLLSWRSELSVPADGKEVALSGSLYHGLGMRLPEFMDKASRFRFSDDASGAFDDGPHHLAQAAWCACAVDGGDNSMTVAMFGAPDNPRPTLWFTMTDPFAYLSATIDLHRDPVVLKAGESLSLHYGAAVWDKEVSDDVVQARRDFWLEAVNP